MGGSQCESTHTQIRIVKFLDNSRKVSLLITILIRTLEHLLVFIGTLGSRCSDCIWTYSGGGLPLFIGFILLNVEQLSPLVGKTLTPNHSEFYIKRLLLTKRY